MKLKTTLNTDTINYSSDLDQRYTNDTQCGSLLTGQMSSDQNNLVHVRLLITDGFSVSTWTETIGQTQSELQTKVSVSSPWNKIYLTRNESCEENSIDIDVWFAKLYDIQLKSSQNNQLYYPHQTLRFNLWKLDMDDNKEEKIGELKFNSVNSDENGWWSPSEVSWERSNIIDNTPTPTVDQGDFQPEEPTPTPINVGDLSSWFAFDSLP